MQTAWRFPGVQQLGLAFEGCHSKLGEHSAVSEKEAARPAATDLPISAGDGDARRSHGADQPVNEGLNCADERHRLVGENRCAGCGLNWGGHGDLFG